MANGHEPPVTPVRVKTVTPVRVKTAQLCISRQHYLGDFLHWSFRTAAAFSQF